MAIKDRLILARKDKGLSQAQLAELVGMTQPGIQRLEKGKVKSTTYIDIIAKALNVRTEWLQTGAGERELIQKPISSRPFPVLPLSEVKDWLTNPILTKTQRVIHMSISEKATGKNAFFVEIQGDAMVSTTNPEESYYNGHLAFIAPERPYKLGDGILIEHKNSLKLRKLSSDGTEKVLEALNPKYENIELEEAQILGVVLWTQRNRVDDLE